MAQPDPFVAQPSHSQTPQAVAVVSPRFCSPTPVDLVIARKLLNVTFGNFAVTDLSGNSMFTLKQTFMSLHDRRVLLDSAGNPVVSMKQKNRSLHRTWQVFRGDSSNSEDLLFTAKLSSLFQPKPKLDVFLANNTKEEVCDFKVKGSFMEGSGTVYVGESSTAIAQMHKKHTVQSVLLGKDKFTVTVNPYIDHAFIATLIVILDDIFYGG